MAETLDLQPLTGEKLDLQPLDLQPIAEATEPDLNDPDVAAVMHARAVNQQPHGYAFKPYIPLPAPTTGTLLQAASALGVPGAKTAQEMVDAALTPVKRAVETIESPGGLALAPIAVAAPEVFGGVTALTSVPEIVSGIKKTAQGIKERDPVKIAGGLGETATGSAGVALGGLAAGSRLLPATEIEAAKAPELRETRLLPAPGETTGTTLAGPSTLPPLKRPTQAAPQIILPPAALTIEDVGLGRKLVLPRDYIDIISEVLEEPTAREPVGLENLPGQYPPTAAQLGTFQTKGPGGGVISEVTQGTPGIEVRPVAGRQPVPEAERITPPEPELVSNWMTEREKSEARADLAQALGEEEANPSSPEPKPGLIAGSKLEQWADRKIQEGRGQMNALAPDQFAAYAIKGVAVLERGITDFKDWSIAMMRAHGLEIRPFLENIYEESKRYLSQKTGQPLTGGLEDKPKSSRPPVGPAAVEEAKQLVKPLAKQRSMRVGQVEADQPPKTNPETGATKSAPKESTFAPDTPPGSNPWPIYAQKARDWWESVWPRSLASMREVPDTPVITAHQRLLFSQQKYMEEFSDEPWWRPFRNRDNNELIQIEDTMVRDFQRRLEAGEDPAAAYRGAVSTAPEDVQSYIAHRDARIPIEFKASTDLGMTPTQYRGEPYIPRLTNRDGQKIVELNPRVTGFGGLIRETLGAFDKSRSHLTMKEGIESGTQYDPVAKAAWIRELTSSKLEATANMLNELREKGVLYDTREAALAASPKGEVWKVEGFGGKDYWARSRQEAKFLDQNLNAPSSNSALGRLVQLANTYIRNPSLVNPLPHTTKNMFFKYLLARAGNAKAKADVAEYTAAEPSELRSRFDQVMPMSESGQRLPQLTAKEVGTLWEKITRRGLIINDPSSKFIFAKADPAMRFALWKSYVRKGMSDQEAANHVWIDLVRYDENSGGMSFWKSIPLNFFVPWRTGTYTTLYKAFTDHPVRSLLFVGAVEYLRELRYRKTGRWTHLPVDYLDAPLAEAIDKPSGLPALAATTLIFGPGGGQAPDSIKDVMNLLHNDPNERARVMNMFWGLSQIYNLPRDWNAFRQDGNPQHLVNLLMNVSLAEHSALKYEPRRLMKWMPEWMPGQQKSELVHYAETLQGRVQRKQERSNATYERRHGVGATFERAPEDQQLQELRRSAR